MTLFSICREPLDFGYQNEHYIAYLYLRQKHRIMESDLTHYFCKKKLHICSNLHTFAPNVD